MTAGEDGVVKIWEVSDEREGEGVEKGEVRGLEKVTQVMWHGFVEGLIAILCVEAGKTEIQLWNSTSSEEERKRIPLEYSVRQHIYVGVNSRRGVWLGVEMGHKLLLPGEITAFMLSMQFRGRKCGREKTRIRHLVHTALYSVESTSSQSDLLGHITLPSFKVNVQRFLATNLSIRSRERFPCTENHIGYVPRGINTALRRRHQVPYPPPYSIIFTDE